MTSNSSQLPCWPCVGCGSSIGCTSPASPWTPDANWPLNACRASMLEISSPLRSCSAPASSRCWPRSTSMSLPCTAHWSCRSLSDSMPPEWLCCSCSARMPGTSLLSRAWTSEATWLCSAALRPSIAPEFSPRTASTSLAAWLCCIRNSSTRPHITWSWISGPGSILDKLMPPPCCCWLKASRSARACSCCSRRRSRSPRICSCAARQPRSSWLAMGTCATKQPCSSCRPPACSTHLAFRPSTSPQTAATDM
mmetsp:Transcript_150540/g.419498  ORF Transcript_150540/g.419498 Transcript_150540/m.419498 type:complete len:252 (-) Transcript_150540:1122-1877(-)